MSRIVGCAARLAGVAHESPRTVWFGGSSPPTTTQSRVRDASTVGVAEPPPFEPYTPPFVTRQCNSYRFNNLREIGGVHWIHGSTGPTRRASRGAADRTTR